MSFGVAVSGERDLSDNSQFQRLLEVKKACDLAQVSYPPEVHGFFKHPKESEETLRSQMSYVEIKEAVRDESNSYGGRYVVDLSKIPPDVKSIVVTIC